MTIPLVFVSKSFVFAVFAREQALFNSTAHAVDIDSLLKQHNST